MSRCHATTPCAPYLRCRFPPMPHGRFSKREALILRFSLRHARVTAIDAAAYRPRQRADAMPKMPPLRILYLIHTLHSPWFDTKCRRLYAPRQMPPYHACLTPDTLPYAMKAEQKTTISFADIPSITSTAALAIFPQRCSTAHYC